jgi:hypothetical protein
MRDYFRDLRHNLVTPRLHGIISAFGTRVTFFEYVAATNTPRVRSPPILYTLTMWLGLSGGAMTFLSGMAQILLFEPVYDVFCSVSFR